GNLVANEMFQSDGTMIPPKTVAEKVVTHLKMISANVSQLIIVSNNVFEDGIEYEEGTRNYIRALGEIHQKLVLEAEEVIEVVAGIPVILKG
ncbi:MAG: bifunctional adenosylcobinamide kinase/adenosylcobinamide-phosphate guanylyltransferase, partial [Lachnospiraceae bacterium]|nr:bifunctional adenosylcobinamide kinase/adenosylcobinamide-phosphate guanylyltransferase [Lachnospiraceae bacterium]